MILIGQFLLPVMQMRLGLARMSMSLLRLRGNSKRQSELMEFQPLI